MKESNLAEAIDALAQRKANDFVDHVKRAWTFLKAMLSGGSTRAGALASLWSTRAK